ncbi:MAG TPA: hypothetical protein VFG30_04205 [Polyangiales bacterium]|nr:hypothetical protein [Polyangiales bacterium]
MSLRVGRQLLLVGLASSLWSVAGVPTFMALAGAYLVAWIACELPPIRKLLREARPRTLVLLAAALAAPGIAFGYRARADLVQREGLLGAVTRFQDRLRAHALPAIAPPLLAIDRPQTWFVATEDAHAVTLFAGGVKPLEAEALGHGLFRIDYDPRRDGIPNALGTQLEITLKSDGRTSERTLELVRPLAHPRWFCIAPDRSRAVALSEETDELFVLRSSGLEKRLPVGDGPVDCAFLDDDHVAVTHRNERSLRVFDLSTGRETRALELSARQGRLARSPSGTLLAVILAGEKAELAIVRLPELTLASRVSLASAADWVAFGTNDDTLFAATRADAAIHRLRANVGTFSEDAKLDLGRPVVTLGRSSDGSQLWAATTDLHAAGHQQLGNHFVQDQILTLDGGRMIVTARRLTAERSDRQTKPGDVDRGVSPMGVHEGREGALWIAFAGTDEVVQVTASAIPRRIDLGDAGLFAPHGVAELADGTLIVSSPVSGAFGILAPDAATPRVVRVAPSDALLLEQNRGALARRVGERGFYEATRSGITCQSCHMHADSDDAAYNLGDHRLLPTLSVRGLADTAPYLRDGSYPRLRDLDDVAQTLYRGYRRNQAARGETVEAFVRSLPRRDSPHFANERDRAAEHRGLAAFYKAQCDTCHRPPAFTDLAQLPLRFLFPDQAAQLGSEEILDTPSLLSVTASAPYLNDGRAKTLEAVLVAQNPQNRHGDVQSLTDSERRDLIAFLSSL